MHDKVGPFIHIAAGKEAALLFYDNDGTEDGGAYLWSIER
jgi:hypothetical protein